LQVGLGFVDAGGAPTKYFHLRMMINRILLVASRIVTEIYLLQIGIQMRYFYSSAVATDIFNYKWDID
jgi:hypothetical protein